MKIPPNESFENYKKSEQKALGILKEMQSDGVEKVDIELALLVAVFELHKGSIPAETISSIVKGHLTTLEPFYRGDAPESNGSGEG